MIPFFRKMVFETKRMNEVNKNTKVIFLKLLMRTNNFIIIDDLANGRNKDNSGTTNIATNGAVKTIGSIGGDDC